MKEKRIEAVKPWPDPQPIWDILVFLGFANFYKQLIKCYSKIVATLTWMLKTTALLTPARPVYTRTNENELDMNSDNRISGDRINDRIANLSSFTKKMSLKASFLTSKTSLAFT